MKRSTVACLVVLVASAVLVAGTRPWLFRSEQELKERSAVYALPSPKVLEQMSLGYRAALADYLWAHVLVTQGLRMEERRPFPEIGNYLDAINHLDPRFREPYRLADSVMSFQVDDPDRQATLRRVREILERGLKSFPYDVELWLNYGQFLAYIAPGSLDEAETRKAWREEGAQALVRAGELGGSDDLTTLRTISAATILTRAGERDAAIRFLERAYTLVENEEAKADILSRLQGLREGQERSDALVLAQKFDALWRRDLPFAPRATLSVVGPPISPWRCAGRHAGAKREPCSRSWTAWAAEVLQTESFPATE